MRTNNHITDLDAIELSSGWNYNPKLVTGKNVNVNNHIYRVIDKVEPTNTGLGYKLYERYENKKPTGKLIISFDGTDFSDLNDINTDLRLAGDSIPNQLLEAGKVYNDLKNKYQDANTMNNNSFYEKYGEFNINYKGKSITNAGGNSLSGAIAQYLGVLDPGLNVTTTNSAPMPRSITRMARRDANNIHNYHSRSDVLTRINIGGLMYNSMVGKHIFLENGVSTFGALIPAHTGYNFEEKEKLDHFDQDNIINKEVYTSRNGLKIYADMDEHTPIFVWSGDAIGAGTSKIKLDKGHLADLYDYVHGRLTEYVNNIDIKTKDIRTSVERENNNFSQHVNETKDHFKKVIKLNELEGWIHNISNLIRTKIESKADELKANLRTLRDQDNILDLVGADDIINSIIDFIDKITDKISKFIKYGENFMKAAFDIVSNTIVKMFVNLSEGFEDGVREEVLAHLNVVIPNIQIIKNQVTHFGDGINDILTQMTHLDDNVMVNNVPINKNATKQTSKPLAESKNLLLNLEIRNKVMESGLATLASNINLLLVPETLRIIALITFVDACMPTLSNFVGKIEWIASKVPFAKTTAETLKSLKNLVDKLHQQLTDMRLILGELIFTEYIINEMQDFFKNALLSDSLLRDIKVLSSNAKGDADMLETELRSVINAMSQNEGKSVDALKNSTASLKNNLTKLKEQLDKTTH
ncbi:hypothetical protein HUZ99_06470 [Staphylococcus sp. SS87]|nr:hypothetical protein [Staphylococcus singaporensis]MBE5676061.1 hypothetical protein [Staphylococcus singaporensis]MBE5677860.1 hypothetical protein [Staphylococcus singaporensis]